MHKFSAFFLDKEITTSKKSYPLPYCYIEGVTSYQGFCAREKQEGKTYLVIKSNYTCLKEVLNDLYSPELSAAILAKYHDLATGLRT